MFEGHAVRSSGVTFKYFGMGFQVTRAERDTMDLSTIQSGLVMKVCSWAISYLSVFLAHSPSSLQVCLPPILSSTCCLILGRSLSICTSGKVNSLGYKSQRLIRTRKIYEDLLISNQKVISGLLKLILNF